MSCVYHCMDRHACAIHECAYRCDASNNNSFGICITMLSVVALIDEMAQVNGQPGRAHFKLCHHPNHTESLGEQGSHTMIQTAMHDLRKQRYLRLAAMIMIALRQTKRQTLPTYRRNRVCARHSTDLDGLQAAGAPHAVRNMMHITKCVDVWNACHMELNGVKGATR